MKDLSIKLLINKNFYEVRKIQSWEPLFHSNMNHKPKQSLKFLQSTWMVLQTQNFKKIWHELSFMSIFYLFLTHIFHELLELQTTRGMELSCNLEQCEKYIFFIFLFATPLTITTLNTYVFVFFIFLLQEKWWCFCLLT